MHYHKNLRRFSKLRCIFVAASHTYTYTYAQTHTHTHICIYIYIYIYIHAHIPTLIYMCTYIHTNTETYINIYIIVYIGRSTSLMHAKLMSMNKESVSFSSNFFI